MMRVLICPDKFKGCLEAAEVAEAVAQGLREGLPGAQLVIIPLADGGEGTAGILARATGGEMVPADASDPLGRPLRSSFAVLGDGRTAVVEMAAASGLALLGAGELDPLRSSTRGTGELILAALERGLRRIIVAIGGSATNDGGMGMAHALGARFLDAGGAELEPCGEALGRVASVDLSGLDPRLAGCEVVVACDVANPLLGEEGATRVYGPQKGAGAEELRQLEEGMAGYASVVEAAVGRRLSGLPGAGAAGGLGFGLMAFLGARAEPGIEVVMRAVGFTDEARACDLVVTGEGRYDAQTSYGKTVAGVVRAARELGKPLVILAGAISDEALTAGSAEGVCCLSIVPRPMGLEEAMATARRNLRYAASQLARLLAGMRGLPAQP
jgi:glycerate kinase